MEKAPPSFRPPVRLQHFHVAPKHYPPSKPPKNNFQEYCSFIGDDAKSNASTIEYLLRMSGDTVIPAPLTTPTEASKDSKQDM